MGRRIGRRDALVVFAPPWRPPVRIPTAARRRWPADGLEPYRVPGVRSAGEGGPYFRPARPRFSRRARKLDARCAAGVPLRLPRSAPEPGDHRARVPLLLHARLGRAPRPRLAGCARGSPTTIGGRAGATPGAGGPGRPADPARGPSRGAHRGQGDPPPTRHARRTAARRGLRQRRLPGPDGRRSDGARRGSTRIRRRSRARARRALKVTQGTLADLDPGEHARRVRRNHAQPRDRAPARSWRATCAASTSCCAPAACSGSPRRTSRRWVSGASGATGSAWIRRATSCSSRGRPWTRLVRDRGPRAAPAASGLAARLADVQPERGDRAGPASGRGPGTRSATAARPRRDRRPGRASRRAARGGTRDDRATPD